MQNMRIRLVAKEYGVALWELAEALNISEPTLYRRLRRELSKEENARFIGTIKKIKEGAGNNERK